jgi:hypothetical protein
MLNKRGMIATLCFMMLCLFIFSACDHTDLSGSIHVMSDKIIKNNAIPLYLDVPQELNDIYRTMWGVIYEDEEAMNDAYVCYGDALLTSYTEDELSVLFGLKALNYDRMAVFTPTQSGTYRIIVDGFYKQTNPQPITELEVTVE